MFFRREKETKLTFSDRLSAARSAGFTVDGSLVTRRGLGCLVTEGTDGMPEIGEAGLLVHGKEVARLVHGGYQMFFVTRDGHKMAALADHLKALHSFTEDLTEALGATSMYNNGLGTICTGHLYDRVKDRDHGVEKRPWE
ncbi:MAG TPA: hypothetical protein VFQ91_25430 [Bryobacteraceae bacterium]|nr:hypothetical protein [Bryobacteraceae bacterium]